MGEPIDFNQFMPLRNHLVNEADIFDREGDFSQVLTPTISKDMDEHLKLFHNVVDLVDGANRKVSVTLLHSSVDKPENSSAEVWLPARK